MIIILDFVGNRFSKYLILICSCFFFVFKLIGGNLGIVEEFFVLMNFLIIILRILVKNDVCIDESVVSS